MGPELLDRDRPGASTDNQIVVVLALEIFSTNNREQPRSTGRECSILAEKQEQECFTHWSRCSVRPLGPRWDRRRVEDTRVPGGQAGVIVDGGRLVVDGMDENLPGRSPTMVPRLEVSPTSPSRRVWWQHDRVRSGYISANCRWS